MWDRAVVFAGLVGGGVIPMAHKVILEGPEGLEKFPLLHVVGMLLSYLVGTFFYVTRVPEKYWPGTFDIWVSTQILYTGRQK